MSLAVTNVQYKFNNGIWCFQSDGLPITALLADTTKKLVDEIVVCVNAQNQNSVKIFSICDEYAESRRLHPESVFLWKGRGVSVMRELDSSDTPNK